MNSSSNETRMQSNYSVVQKLAMREITGFLWPRNSPMGKMGRIYDKCPEHLQISLQKIISQRNLLLGHVIIGFSRDGKYILSYQCRIIDEMEDGCPYLGYRYSLHWWQFHFKLPSKKVHAVPLFVGEDISNELHLLICQPPAGNNIIIHGSSSRPALNYGASCRSSQSSTCYLTLAPSPFEDIQRTKTSLACSHSQKTFALHLKYELVPPHPPFFPSVNLKFDDTILINSGDLICALNTYVTDKTDQRKTSSELFGPLNCKSDCFCGFLSRQRSLPCVINSRETPCTCRFLLNPHNKTIIEQPEVLHQNLNRAKLSASFCDSYLSAKECNANESTSEQCEIVHDYESSIIHSDLSGHTSCYLSVFSNRFSASVDTPNSPFDCTSTAFPITITTDQGTIVPQVSSHRCSAEPEATSQLTDALEDADVIVKQVVFDAEQFLDRKLRNMESIKDRFVSLKDYDMQLVQVCVWSREVIILIKVLIHLNGKLGETSASPRLSTYMTGFLLSWNIQTGAMIVLEEQPVFEFQKQKCKSRSACHGLEQAVELRRKNFVPTNFKASVLSFSNHTVFSGKSMKYLLHPFQPLAIVM